MNLNITPDSISHIVISNEKGWNYKPMQSYEQKEYKPKSLYSNIVHDISYMKKYSPEVKTKPQKSLKKRPFYNSQDLDLSSLGNASH